MLFWKVFILKSWSGKLKMKNIMLRFAIFITTILIFNVNAVALEIKSETNFELSEIKENKNYYLDLFSIKSLDNESDIYKDRFFYSFDVSDNGDCAVFFDNAVVVITDSNCAVKKVLQFNEEILNVKIPQTLIRWNEENLELIMGYHVLCIFTPDGEIVDIYNYKSSSSILSIPSQFFASENTYTASYRNIFVHFLGGNRYDTLTRTDIVGNERVIFQCDRKLPNVTIFFIMFLTIWHIAALFVVMKVKRRQRKRQGTAGQGDEDNQDTVL
jgi:hypothetical protein